MKYNEAECKLKELGFVCESDYHPEGKSFKLITDNAIIHACISYPFMETWRHEGGKGTRLWYGEVEDIKPILDKLISIESV